MTSFPELVESGMRQKNISLRAVAREIRLDPSFFSKVLAGKRTPPSDEKTLNRLADLLGIDPLKLIISTGLIPSQIRPMLESDEFLRSVRGRKPFAPILAPVHAPRTASAYSGADFVQRKRPELSEDLL